MRYILIAVLVALACFTLPLRSQNVCFYPREDGSQQCDMDETPCDGYGQFNCEYNQAQYQLESELEVFSGEDAPIGFFVNLNQEFCCDVWTCYLVQERDPDEQEYFYYCDPFARLWYACQKTIYYVDYERVCPP